MMLTLTRTRCQKQRWISDVPSKVPRPDTTPSSLMRAPLAWAWWCVGRWWEAEAEAEAGGGRRLEALAVRLEVEV
ncbi:hypothetical protein ACRE_068960 [Hapsidospora chrysogenum ATCC 11550]|uniref:Uncharacterized protein n=1 Tax=Hapsidospora chrysogenum (strain ATCC 11550 / CBS 779.69 / DSM 880 / IAM 14645 / JCM 23072 / IMI 49137) TaxID=857340 RepID=A0A086SZ27_HAPC1|nr:hypothetical protein ACRE_068960 [Hapsidospora chrysogenum ATCC 11550]